jgi:hypothetical protein
MQLQVVLLQVQVEQLCSAAELPCMVVAADVSCESWGSLVLQLAKCKEFFFFKCSFLSARSKDCC